MAQATPPESAPSGAAAPAPATDDLEATELARRLKDLDWPAPPDEVRERCFQRILQNLDGVQDRDAQHV